MILCNSIQAGNDVFTKMRLTYGAHSALCQIKRSASIFLLCWILLCTISNHDTLSIAKKPHYLRFFFFWVINLYKNKTRKRRFINTLDQIHCFGWCRWVNFFRSLLPTWINFSRKLQAPSHYLNQCWNIVNSNLRNKLQWNFNLIHFHWRKCIWNVVRKTAAILSRLQCVNSC